MSAPAPSFHRLAVYCGSSSGVSPRYAEAAEAFGTLLAQRRIEVVYGGGRVGLMGILADAALAAGGHVRGVIPHFLKQREVDHQGLTELFVVSSMHERKAKMADLADGFVALPGGIGTLEELFEVWTWSVLGAHRKPLGVLDVGGFYAPLLAACDHAVTEGFMKPEHRAALVVASDGEALLEGLARWTPPDERWLKPDQT